MIFDIVVIYCHVAPERLCGFTLLPQRFNRSLFSMVAVTSSPPLSGPEQVAARLFRLSIGVFFIGGFLTSSVSLLVPRLKLMLDLDYKSEEHKSELQSLMRISY